MSSHKSSKKRKESAAASKTVYLIRHGHSEGQDAKRNGLDRKRDLSLRDCGLSSKGVQQSEQIRSFLEDNSLPLIELVVSSPLTRALQTAVYGFQYLIPQPPILVHFGLREIASTLPENFPRETKDALEYIRKHNRKTEDINEMQIDSESLQPSSWPLETVVTESASSGKVERIQQIFQWLAKERPEKCVAVVCHYNVIRAALSASCSEQDIRPQNAGTIPCHLYSDGRLKKCEEF